MPRQEPGVAPRARAWLPSGISSFLFVDRHSLPNRDDAATPTKRPRRPLLAAAFLLWLIVVGVGLGRLWAYAQTPGPAAHASALWPAATALVRDTHRPTLLVFAHPQCPCSRATIGELAILMAHARDRVTAYVIFYRPLNVEAGWEQTDLWRSAAAIPGVRVLPDENGADATVFDAATSGQTLLSRRGRAVDLQRRHDRGARTLGRQRGPHRVDGAAHRRPIDSPRRRRPSSAVCWGPGRTERARNASAHMNHTSDILRMTRSRTAAIFTQLQQQVFQQTDRMFAVLMAAQWIFGVGIAYWISPLTWAGTTSGVHPHILAAIFLGGAISAFPIALALTRPGQRITRYTIAIGQMLTSALLIHLTGGGSKRTFTFSARSRSWRSTATGGSSSRQRPSSPATI